MTEPHREPGRWENYDRSSLAKLLRFDSWDKMTAISLLCDIDPAKSEFFSPERYFGSSAVKNSKHDTSHPFWKIRLLNTSMTAAPPRCWYESEEDFDRASAAWDAQWSQNPKNDEPYISLYNVIAPCLAAERKFVDALEIFDSSPDHRQEPDRSPQYFVVWAKSKDLEINWLDWAVHNGFIKPARNTGRSTGKPKPDRLDGRTQITELQEAAVQMAIRRRVTDAMPKKNITVEKICQWLLDNGSFSTGEKFTTRWRSIEGVRRYLKGKNNPLSDERYLNAKPLKQGRSQRNTRL